MYPAVVGRSRLWVTDWFAMQWRHLAIAPEPESDAYYDLLRRYARNLADHRHGIADYELLCQLDERDSAKAQRLAREHIQAFDRYETDVTRFRATRRELLESLSSR